MEPSSFQRAKISEKISQTNSPKPNKFFVAENSEKSKCDGISKTIIIGIFILEIIKEKKVCKAVYHVSLSFS